MALVSGWLTTAPEGVITSKRSIVTADRTNSYWLATPVYWLVTKTSTTTVTLYKGMTYEAAYTLATTTGLNACTVDVAGNVTSSSTAEVQLANEAGAYNVVRTQFYCTVVQTGPTAY